MHCLRARVITIMMLMSIACINWSVAGSGSARRAMDADHASVKVIKALLRRATTCPNGCTTRSTLFFIESPCQRNGIHAGI